MTARGRQGFALIAVLWVLVLASALAVEVHGTVRADQRAVANARAAARARWAARGALAVLAERIRERLANPTATGAFAATDALLVPAVEYRLEGVAVRATAHDAHARVQLNLASEAELRALFAAAGADPSVATDVVRWRAAHAPPAIAPDSSGRRLRPPPGAFAGVHELRGIVPAADYERVAPLLTVAGDGRVNVNTAPVAVLRTLPGIDAEGAAALAERRRTGPVLSPYELLDALPRASRTGAQDRLAELRERAAYLPRHVDVAVTAAPDGSPVRARIRAVAVLAGGSRAALVSVVER